MKKSDWLLVAFFLIIVVLVAAYLFHLGGLSRLERTIVGNLKEEGFGIKDVFAILILAMLIAGFVLMFRFREKKGNVTEYDVSSFHPVWNDNIKLTGDFGLNTRPKQRRFFMLIALSAIAVAIIVYVMQFFTYTDVTDISVSIAIVAMVMSFFVLFVMFAVIMLRLAKRLFREGKDLENRALQMFQEGLLFSSHFIEWKNIKALSYPLTFRMAERMGFVVPTGGLPALHTLKIKDVGNKSYYVEIVDKDGFEDALYKLSKKQFLD